MLPFMVFSVSLLINGNTSSVVLKSFMTERSENASFMMTMTFALVFDPVSSVSGYFSSMALTVAPE